VVQTSENLHGYWGGWAAFVTAARYIETRCLSLLFHGAGWNSREAALGWVFMAAFAGGGFESLEALGSGVAAILDQPGRGCAALRRRSGALGNGQRGGRVPRWAQRA